MKPATGVFICHCGNNIGGAIDIERLKAAARAEGATTANVIERLCQSLF